MSNLILFCRFFFQNMFLTSTAHLFSNTKSVFVGKKVWISSIRPFPFLTLLILYLLECMDWIQSFHSPPGCLLVGSPPPLLSRSSTSSSRHSEMWSKPRSSKIGRASLKVTASLHSRQKRRPGDCRWEMWWDPVSQLHNCAQGPGRQHHAERKKTQHRPGYKETGIKWRVVSSEVMYHARLARLYTPI